MDWSELAKELAHIGLPLLGAALPLPGGAAIGTALAAAIGTDAKPETISGLLAANTGALEKAREFEMAHKETLLRIATDAEVRKLEIGAQDKANARERETKIADSVTPRVLAAFAVILFIALVYAVLRGASPVEGMKDTFLILIGAAIAVFKDVYGYYFGSSAGSRDNQEALRNMTKDK